MSCQVSTKLGHLCSNRKVKQMGSWTSGCKSDNNFSWEDHEEKRFWAVITDHQSSKGILEGNPISSFFPIRSTQPIAHGKFQGKPKVKSEGSPFCPSQCREKGMDAKFYYRGVYRDLAKKKICLILPPPLLWAHKWPISSLSPWCIWSLWSPLPQSWKFLPLEESLQRREVRLRRKRVRIRIKKSWLKVWS